jgi:hypothetical protein
MHRAVLDIASRLVHLDSPVYGKDILHLPVTSHIKASLHHVVELKLEDIHVVREFLDVFPDDLPGMPPKRVIEFKIELQPGTAPIAKALYKMSHVETKDLKIQLQGLVLRLNNEHPNCLKAISSDNGAEFMNDSFDQFCLGHGVDQQLSAPRVPQ